MKADMLNVCWDWSNMIRYYRQLEVKLFL